MKHSRTIAKIALALLLGAVIAGIYLSPLRDSMTREGVRDTVAQLRGLWYGPIVFIALYAVGCVLAIPATLFVLAGGAIWGWKLGASYAMVGGILGAVSSFYIGRFLGEGILLRFGRLGQRVARQVDHAGFRSLLVFRFIPGIPFAVLNYGAGAAGVRLNDFVLATLIGMAPSKYVFAYCADSLFNGTMTEGDAVQRMLIVGALMLTLMLIPSIVKRRFAPAAVVVEPADPDGELV